MAAAFLDDQLGLLLRQVFIDDERVADELLEASKPLGTFSSRIDLAFLLGYLGENERRDLHLIRKIRNAFGHTASFIGFDDLPIASRCRELAHSYHESSYAPRGHFTAAAFAILSTIDVSLLFSVKHATKRVDRVPNCDRKREVHEFAAEAVRTAYETVIAGSGELTEDKLDEANVLVKTLILKRYFKQGETDTEGDLQHK